MHRLGIVRIQLGDSDESHPVVRIWLEYAVDDADMKVRVQIERGAEAVDECHRAGPRIRPRAWAMCAQVTLDLIEEDAQRGIEGLAVTLEVIA